MIKTDITYYWFFQLINLDIINCITVTVKKIMDFFLYYINVVYAYIIFYFIFKNYYIFVYLKIHSSESQQLNDGSNISLVLKLTYFWKALISF